MFCTYVYWCVGRKSVVRIRNVLVRRRGVCDVRGAQGTVLTVHDAEEAQDIS